MSHANGRFIGQCVNYWDNIQKNNNQNTKLAFMAEIKKKSWYKKARVLLDITDIRSLIFVVSAHHDITPAPNLWGGSPQESSNSPSVKLVSEPLISCMLSA